MTLLHRSSTEMRGTIDHNVKIEQCSQFYKSYGGLINILLLVALSASVFSNSLWSYYLIVDDLGIVPHTIRGIVEVFTGNTYGVAGQGGNYRPLEVLPHMFDSYFFGEDPFGRHLTNVLTHICNLILVYVIAFSLTRIKGIALLTGLLFAIHPVHSQSLPPVAWISGRTDLFVTLFYLMAVFLFMEFSKKQGLLLYIGSLIAFGLALLSKEMAITLPLLIITYLILDPRDNYKDRYETYHSSTFKLVLVGGLISVFFGLIFNTSIIEGYLSSDGVLDIATVKNIHLFQMFAITEGALAMFYSLFILKRQNSGKLYQCVKYGMPYFIILSIFLFTRLIILGDGGGIYKSDNGNVLLQFGIDTFLRDIYSLAGLIWPVGISYNLDIFTLQIDHSYIFYIVGVVAMAMLIILLFGCLKYSKALAFSYSWIFITLIPVHNILIPSWHFQSRYLYLPSVGFCMFVSILLYRWGICNSRIWSFRRILVVGSVIVYVAINMILIREYNENIYHSGEITRELVSNIRSSQADSSEKKNLIFLTFPLSSIDTPNTVYITSYMHEVLRHAVGWVKANKYSYQFILFSSHRENVKFNVSSPEDGVFILDATGDAHLFRIPKYRSVEEEKIKTIYKLLHPENMLKPITGEGGHEETKNARIKVLASGDKRANTMTLHVELKEVSPGSGKPYFYIFDQGHFKLLPVKSYGAETEYPPDDSVQPKAL